MRKFILHLLHGFFPPPRCAPAGRAGVEKETLVRAMLADALTPPLLKTATPFLFVEDTGLAADVAAWLTAGLRAFRARELVAADERLRRGSAYYAPSGALELRWINATPADVGRFSQRPDAAPLLGLFSMHPNGFVRERAVALLSGSTTGDELPFLIIRSNDWVADVRTAALAALQERLKPAYRAHFLKHLPLVSRLERAERANHGPFLRAVHGLFAAPDARAFLFEGLRSSDRATARLCAGVALAGDGPAEAAFATEALQSHDVVVAARAAAWFRRSDVCFYTPTVESLMSGHRSSLVRRQALNIALEKAPDMAAGALQRALFDGNAGVRWTAQFFSQQAGRDPGSEYARVLSSNAPPDVLFAALRGAGELDRRDAVGRVREMVEDKSVRIAKAALAALARLEPEGRIELGLRLLRDEREGLSREAREILIPVISGVCLNDLRDALSAAAPHVRRNAFALLSHLRKWQTLLGLLETSPADHPVAWDDALRRWLKNINQSFVAPTAEERRDLSSALARRRGSLPPLIGNEIDHILHPYGAG
jgi:HEAT repeat protein